MKCLVLFVVFLILFVGACSSILCEVGTEFTPSGGTAVRNKVDVLCPNVTDACFRGDATFVPTSGLNTLTGSGSVSLCMNSLSCSALENQCYYAASMLPAVAPNAPTNIGYQFQSCMGACCQTDYCNRVTTPEIIAVIMQQQVAGSADALTPSCSLAFSILVSTIGLLY